MENNAYQQAAKQPASSLRWLLLGLMWLILLGAGLYFSYESEELETMQHATGFVDIVNDARTRIRETDVVSIHDRLAAGERFFLVDVREESEWQRDHIPGAVHIGRGVIERDIEDKIPDKAAEIVLYCGGGYRSALAADNLQKMGYHNVISMDGGMRAWREHHFEVE